MSLLKEDTTRALLSCVVSEPRCCNFRCAFCPSLRGVHGLGGQAAKPGQLLNAIPPVQGWQEEVNWKVPAFFSHSNASILFNDNHLENICFREEKKCCQNKQYLICADVLVEILGSSWRQVASYFTGHTKLAVNSNITAGWS